MNRLGKGALMAIALWSSVAFAKTDEGIPLTVLVVDESGQPIPNAWVRIPDTEGRRRTDPSGTWTASFVYTYDGAEVFFQRGMVLELTISAPGFASRLARYRVKAHRNELTVPMKRIKFERPEIDAEIVWFKRNPADTDGAETDDGTPREPEPTPPVEPQEEPSEEDGSLEDNAKGGDDEGEVEPDSPVEEGSEKDEQE
ncbi:MAG: carboxypeptidase regulatory-like domain-containing protein [Deltaproteobacteria bacterium]|nr:carboxypeptidase regulatory-like domain-containing protein [Deltaproteobacteria bacterium]MBW2257744.1 carboxypeptidase regulatory-like domain-containing protein [Deltaproteobacteria bacterium]